MSDDYRPALFPHVHAWQWPLLYKFGERLHNTGGNPPEELLNELQNPGTPDRPNRLASTNEVRFLLACCVSAQVNLLSDLIERGDLPS